MPYCPEMECQVLPQGLGQGLRVVEADLQGVALHNIRHLARLCVFLFRRRMDLCEHRVPAALMRHPHKADVGEVGELLEGRRPPDDDHQEAHSFFRDLKECERRASLLASEADGRAHENMPRTSHDVLHGSLEGLGQRQTFFLDALVGHVLNLPVDFPEHIDASFPRCDGDIALDESHFRRLRHGGLFCLSSLSGLPRSFSKDADSNTAVALQSQKEVNKQWKRGPAKRSGNLVLMERSARRKRRRTKKKS
mmetsp:Transcript_16959/g.36508  ORF Transcript_16959/g.36508 Transcript_16959/m.36508 type:complete len:251 (-) Transcript_16959:152-904(-)